MRVAVKCRQCYLNVENTRSLLVADEIVVHIASSWAWKMSTFHILFYIHLLCTQTLSHTVCDVKHTTEPLYGYHCVASGNTEISMSQKDGVLRCLLEKTCYYINYNYGTDQCHLGLDRCGSLVPVIGGAVQVFGPPQDTCVLWGSRDESGRQSIEVPNDGFVMYLARVMIGDILIVGIVKAQHGYFVANNENVRVGPIRETDHKIEFCTVDPACTLLWIPYRAGGILPDGVISGGRLADGSPTYVSRDSNGNALPFGYYDIKSELAYYQMGDSYTTSTMELLILL